ncbi:MAG: 23S rRNA (uridine(2552)-2'-O)-methyltransferase RlmE [Pseudomonadota bacterium]|uniref:23S rRNA (uridine(2552)-2'-O)-methyltransferase RlmE n=1 Tax=Thermithiobacillus tepidarius TaxID=929 RepID=UPI0004010011|nr:23S rRNA (uridine(2552)-2'-O)-methyltransferase RlmE [Thermithiobacillus tepidarius]
MSKSSHRWLKEHFNDPFVKRAAKEGYRSRAAYKLLEIQEKDRILRPGMRVVDLGAAPGGWSQVAARILGDRGQVIALDRLPMDPIPHVTFIQGDFNDEAVYEALMATLEGQPVDLVICDIAPNMSGINVVDQARAMQLAELALDFAVQVLKPGGAFLIKVFMGAGADALRAQIKSRFQRLVVRKPEASRARSAEQYWLATGFKGA